MKKSKDKDEEINPHDISELIKVMNSVCLQTQAQINQVCSSINQTNTTIIEDRQIASVGVSQLADAMHDAQRTQRDINKQLFDKIGGLSEAMLSQSKIIAEQTKAIGDVSKAIHKLANEFSEHRGKSEEREKTARQSQQHAKDSLDRVDVKVDKMHGDSEKLNLRLTVVEKSRSEKADFLQSTFSKTMAILTLISAVSIGIAALLISLNSAGVTKP